MSAQDSLRGLDALVRVALRVAQSARSGRVALAQVADAIEFEWVPRPWGDDIVAQLEEASRRAREPLEFRQVERALRDAWGGDPEDELEELDAEPVASTPGSQVHRGRLDGKPVAVKVLRPGLAGSVRQDLTLLEALASPLDAAFPALDTGAVLGEVRERVLEELDLESEATLMRRFHRALRGHPFLTVPAPVMRLCHDQVLVSEWVDGVPLDQAPDPDQAAGQLMVFALGAARWGVAYADPHLENTLVTEDGGLAIVDFGASREMGGERLERATALLEALLGEDEAEFAAQLEALGWLPAAQAPTALRLVREALDGLLGPGPVHLDSAAVIEARDRLLERAEALAELLAVGKLAPEDLWPARGVAQLLGTIARIGATGEWAEMALSALREGWMLATPRG